MHTLTKSNSKKTSALEVTKVWDPENDLTHSDNLVSKIYKNDKGLSIPLLDQN